MAMVAMQPDLLPAGEHDASRELRALAVELVRGLVGDRGAEDVEHDVADVPRGRGLEMHRLAQVLSICARRSASGTRAVATTIVPSKARRIGIQFSASIT